ncbi:tetratricopeptide repeat protein [Brachyspira pulli]|uniref:tetratricopeptide repeat protein n=1 Tax=Brachyspira pulli TaxID=310721 RepID=UPI0030063379
MNFTEQEQDYYELILDILDDGAIVYSERILLNKKKDKYGISDERAKEIEDFALQEIQNKNKPEFNTEGEEEYYELLEDMLEDGIIDDSERSLLNKRKVKYVISDERAKEFEDYIKSVKGINETVSDSSNKENAKDLFEQGKSYINDENYEEAIKCFKKAVELNPDNANNWQLLGRSYEGNDNNEEAMKCLNKALELDPNDADNWYWLGYIYYKDANYEDAIKYLSKSVELNPNISRNWYRLADSYFYNGDYDEAMQVYNKTIEVDPTIAMVLEFRGLNRFINGTVENTLYLLNRELETEYRNSKLKNITTKSFDYIKSLIINPIYDEDSNYYNYPIEFFVLSENIIGYLFNFERYSDVIYLKRKLFNIIIHSENNYIDDVYISIMSGRASLCLENYDKAIRKFYYLMRHYELDDERLASVWFYLGYCHCELGYLEEAKNDYENAIELNDNDSACWNNYGLTLERMGYTTDAREAYQKALEIDPDNEFAMNNLNSLRYNNSSSGGFISDIISGISDLFK